MNLKTGAKRELIRESEVPIELRKTCPLSCLRKNFKVKITAAKSYISTIRYPTRSLKVELDGFTIEHQEEYLECDSTCIIGHLGGNIGFFLGFSILLGLDVVFEKVRILVWKIKTINLNRKIHTYEKVFNN